MILITQFNLKYLSEQNLKLTFIIYVQVIPGIIQNSSYEFIKDSKNIKTVILMTFFKSIFFKVLKYFKITLY